MAITYVGGVVAGRTGNSNATINVSLSSGLTGGSDTGVSAGDLVIVTVCTASAARSSVVAVSAPATYQNLTAQRTTATTYDTNVQVSYKFMPATPDSVVTIPAQGNIADGQAYAVQVFRGVDPNTPLDVTPTYATGSGTNNNPNPAAITPVTAGAWIVVTGGGASSTGTTLYTASYLTNFLTQNGADTNDGTVGVGYYTGWTSGAYDPAAFGGGSANTANSWGATTIALRPAPETQTLTPNLYSNTQTFYAPSVIVGAVSLTPALYENGNTFYTHDLTQVIPSQDLIASLYENANSFYTQTLSSSITLNATLYENGNTFYTPVITTGSVTLTAALFSNDNTFYQPIIDRGAVALSASLYSNTNAFYAANVTLGAVNLNPELFTNTNEFYGHTLDVGTVNIAPDLFANVNEFYQSNVTVGAVTLTASLFENSNTFYQHNVTGVASNQTLTPDLFTNANDFYAVTVNQGVVTITVDLFTNTNDFYAPSIEVGAVTLSLEIFVNDNELYAPSVGNVVAQNLTVDLFTNINAFYGINVDFAKYAYAQRDSSVTTVETRENIQDFNRLNNVSSVNRKLSVSFRQPNVVKSRR